MTPTLENELRALLSVRPEHVDGLLEELILHEPSPPFKGLKLRFFFVRFQDDSPRVDHLIWLLLRFVPPFCLKREKFNNLDSTKITDLYLEAKRKFVRVEGNKTGEPGELIIYFLLEGCLGVPKILSKMSLKTNSQMHVHGADGVHLGVDEPFLVLYFGEAKLHTTHTDAISDTLESIKTFISASTENPTYTQKDFEINVIADEIDLPEGGLREKLLSVLDPYGKERDKLKYTYACFIGFDLKELGDKCEVTRFQELYEKKAKSCYQNLVKKIAKDDVLRGLSWHFFFIPFSSVDDFRTRFFGGLSQ